MEPNLRRTVIALAASYALMWSGMSMVAGPGSQALVSLSGNLSYAGLFVALIYLSAAASAAWSGRLMDRVGRRPVLIVAHLVGAVGYLAAGASVSRGSLAGFVAGTIALSMAFGAGNLTRVAVAEMFPPAIRGRGIATVQLSATLGAITGPLLLLASVPLARAVGEPAGVLVWYLAPPLLVAASIAVSRGLEPLAIAKDLPRYHPTLATASAPSARPPAVSGPAVLTAGGIALAASHASMASLMGVAGAAVVHAGHGTSTLGVLMLSHFVGMFGLSRQVGGIADRFGRRNTIFSGLAILALGGFTIALDRGPWGFGLGLLLAGVGWSFAFIGGTVLLTDATMPATRARTIGRADLAAQLSAACVAIGGGWWFARNGLPGLGALAIIVTTVAAGTIFVLLREPTMGRTQEAAVGATPDA